MHAKYRARIGNYKKMYTYINCVGKTKNHSSHTDCFLLGLNGVLPDYIILCASQGQEILCFFYSQLWGGGIVIG